MKTFIILFFVILGLAIMVFSGYLFYTGLRDLILQIQENFSDASKIAWAIVRLFPLTELIFGMGFLVLISALKAYIED